MPPTSLHALPPPGGEPLPADAAVIYTVSVRALCEHTARQGDLGGRMTPSPTAAQGIEGHQRVVARRGAGYEAEVGLSATVDGLRVRGRADGFDPALARLEEIKTHRGDLALQPEGARALHRAQLRCYGALFCEARGLSALRLALVYWDLGRDVETVVEETTTAADLQAEFHARCRSFLAWARQEAAHRQARNTALKALAFPHAGFRPGQRELATAVWRAARRGQPLMAQAPTGIGKTLATLYPLLRAMPDPGLDQIYFLSARTPGRQLALDALQTLRQAGAQPLRVLELTARDKACLYPDRVCHGAACPLAQGFFDRLPAARAQALAQEDLRAATLRTVAADHRICPYWLAQDLMRWSDVVVGDYTHYFDGSAALHALAVETEGRCAVLVDEAHNLVDRARQMYSADLDEGRWRALRRGAPPALLRPLQALLRAWSAWGRERAAGNDPPAAVLIQDDLPQPLLRPLAKCAEALAEALATPSAFSPQWQEAWFEALAFLRLTESHGPHACLEARPGGSGRSRGWRLTLRNLLPAPHLAPRWTRVRTAVLFSATLGPPDSAQDLLGLPPDTAWVDLPSPFRPEQLDVVLVPQITTRWQGRERSVQPIADLIADRWRRLPGNYLAYFSSHDYLAQVAERLAHDHPDVPQWSQERTMDEAARAAFLARFTDTSEGVGFAVLGGAFGEGIDLPGRRLIGAFVATLGLPQVNPSNEHLRACLQRTLGRGYDEAYLIPGLRKVVQAAGRVIRGPADQGVIYLIDDRYAQPQVRALLPAWWQPRRWPGVVDNTPRPPAAPPVTGGDRPRVGA